MSFDISRKSVSLVLPWPVSANRYWRTYFPKGFAVPVTTLSSEAKSYKREVARIAYQQGIREPLKGKVEIEMHLYPQRPKDWAKRAKADKNWDLTVKSIDLDNARKVLYDSLKNVVFQDDKYVFRDHGYREVPDDKPARVEVTIWEMEGFF